jgi:hypothetical protein
LKLDTATDFLTRIALRQSFVQSGTDEKQGAVSKKDLKTGGAGGESQKMQVQGNQEDKPKLYEI